MEANKDAAEHCKDIARSALESGQYDKAVKFAKKAVRLQGGDPGAVAFLERIQRSASSAGASSCEQERSEGRSSEGTTTQPSFGRARSEGGTRRGAEGERTRANERRSQANGADASTRPVDEEVRLVQSFRSKSCLYEVLDVQRNASSDEIRKAYKKLAPKLHPDKNRVPGAEDAFKKVNQAYSILSEPAKRREYDQQGELLANNPLGGVNGVYTRRGQFDARGDDPFNVFFNIDPDEFFRFNPFMHAAAQHYASSRRHRPASGMSAHPDTRNLVTLLRTLLSVMPIIILLLANLLSGSSRPPYSLSRNRQYGVQMSTDSHGIPFYVPSEVDFISKFPKSSRERIRMEVEIENEWRKAKQQACYHERLTKQHYQFRGQQDKAAAVKTPSCDELESIFGSGRH